jgi:hypothetical protein
MQLLKTLGRLITAPHNAPRRSPLPRASGAVDPWNGRGSVQREDNTARRIFFGLALLSFLTILPGVHSWSDGSRIATIQSMVDFHSLSIDHSTFVDTGDKVFINGHFYSDKLAAPSLIGAVVYFPLSLLNIKLNHGLNLAYYLITLLTVKVFWLAGLVAFYRTLVFTPLSGKGRIWLTLALGLGSLYFTWSATFNNHSLAASWVAIGFYFSLNSKRSTHIRSNLFLSGFFFGLAASSDVPILAVYVAFLLYIFVDGRLRASVLWYLLPLLLTVLPVLLVNYHISGSIVPVQLVSSYFQYPGSTWQQADLTGVGINQGTFLANYTFNCLLGSRGFILYNPMLFVAIPLLLRELSPRREFVWEARAVCLASAPIVLYYLIFSNNYSGWSYSIRWFVPLLPLWFFFMYSFLVNLNGGRKVLFLALFSASTVIAVLGLANPWSSMNLSSYPVVANIKTILGYIAALRGRIFG